MHCNIYHTEVDLPADYDFKAALGDHKEIELWEWDKIMDTIKNR